MSRRGAIAGLLIAAGCAAKQPVPTESAHVAPLWPKPPAPALVRWIGSFPDGREPRRERRPWWSRALRAAAGVTDAPERVEPILERPFGVVATASGFVVTDPDLRKVLRVSWPNARADAVKCGGREWEMPMAAAVVDDGTLYVADGSAGVVVAVPPQGACRVIGHGMLERPTGVAWLEGKLYVVDPPRHRVLAFDASGQRVLEFGGRGEAGGPGLNFPTGIAARGAELLVVDALNFRVSRFDPAGEYRGSFGAPGDGAGAFARPKAVAVDDARRVFVSDAQHDVVVIYSSDAKFELAIGGTGGGPGELSLPAGVAVRGSTLYVADSHHQRVEIYELVGGSP